MGNKSGKKRKGFYYFLLAILFISAFAAVKEYVGPENRMRRTLDRGFDKIMASAPTLNSAADADEAVLSFLKQFREEKVGWAIIEDKKVIVSEMEEKEKAAWLAIIPPEHFLEERQKAVIERSARTKNNVLTVKLTPISEEWAGILMVRELVRLVGRVSSDESLKITEEDYLDEEAKALRLPILALDKFSGGMFKEIAGRITDKNKKRAWQDFLLIYQGRQFWLLNNNPRQRDELDDIFEQFDFMTKTAPRSEEERNLRDIIYLAAVSFAVIGEIKEEDEKDAAFREATAWLLKLEALATELRAGAHFNTFREKFNI